MNGFPVFLGFVFLFSVVSATSCPAGTPTKCSCTNVAGNFKVKCVNEDGINEMQSWLPINTTYLEFDACNIRTLAKENFTKLVDLRTLKINNQEIPLTFSDGLVFQGLKNLTDSYFDGCKINSLPRALFANLPRLELLSLNGNPLKTLPEDLLKNSTNIIVFYVGDTRLSDEDLAKIGSGHFGTNIILLSISGTPIENLKDGFFSGLPELNIIEAAGCGIKSIGADILNGTKTDEISLNNNTIQFIHKNAFRNLDAPLVNFYCSSCQLTSNVTFNGFLKNIPKLSKLNLTDNAITFIPAYAFTGIRFIDLIDLSNNQISAIEDNAFPADFVWCDDTACIQLDNNPLNCDCNLASFRSFAEKIKGDRSDWKCAKPNNVAGKSLMSLKIDQFCCNSTCGLPPLPVPTPNIAWFVSAHTGVYFITLAVGMISSSLLFIE
jgi:hypothetical protein